MRDSLSASDGKSEESTPSARPTQRRYTDARISAANQEQSRYLYMIVRNQEQKSTEDAPATRLFKRYKLSDNKTFDSLFFKEKVCRADASPPNVLCCIPGGMLCVARCAL